MNKNKIYLFRLYNLDMTPGLEYCILANILKLFNTLIENANG